MVRHTHAAALLLVCAALACAAPGVSASGSTAAAAARAAAEEAALLRELGTPVASYLLSPAKFVRVAAAAGAVSPVEVELAVQTTRGAYDGDDAVVDGSKYAGKLNRHNKRATRKSRHTAKGRKGYYAPEADKYGKHEEGVPEKYKYPTHTHKPYQPAPVPVPSPSPKPYQPAEEKPAYKPDEYNTEYKPKGHDTPVDEDKPEEEYKEEGEHEGPVHYKYPGKKEEAPQPEYKEHDDEEKPEYKEEEKPEYKEKEDSWLIPPYKEYPKGDKYEKKYEKKDEEYEKKDEKEEEYGYDLEHKVCLQEVERVYFGTPDYPQPDVASNFTSIVACCNQVGGYDAYESYTGSSYGVPAAPKPVVGQCHWTITPREPRGSYDHGYGDDYHTTKKMAATVEATCVLTNAAASECVPFGDFKDGAMVSFKLRHGYWYRTSAAAPSVVEEDEPEPGYNKQYNKYDYSKQYKPKEYKQDEYYENNYGKKQYKYEQYKKNDDGWFFPTLPSKVAAANAAAQPSYSSDESYEYGGADGPVVIEAVRGKADVFMGHISHVHEIASGDDGYSYAAAAVASYNNGEYDGGYKHYDSYGSYGSGDYGHPVKGIKGGVLEFVAGFITTDGTVLYPDYNNTDLQPVEDYRELSSEGAVPLVTPGAAWFKFEKGYPSKEDYYKDDDYYKQGDEYYQEEEYHAEEGYGEQPSYAEEGYENEKPYAAEGHYKRHPKHYEEPEYAAGHEDGYAKPHPHHKHAGRYKNYPKGYVNPPSSAYEGDEGYANP